MKKTNTSRLATMMDFLGITGRELANALHVDYSLVSKWRNNSRRLSSKSTHLTRTAEYFLAKDREADYVHIRKALGDHYEDVHSADVDTLQAYLMRWLSETTSIGTYASIVRSDPKSHVYTAQFEVYQGNEGRRNSVMRFLDYALTLPQGQDLLLLSQEEMSWMLEDQQFLMEWRGKLMELVARRTTITIVHTLDRDLRDLTSVLTQWLPLHMSGRLRSYFHPRYADSSTKYTFFIVKGHVAVTGSQTTLPDALRYTSYFTDFASVAQLESVFQAFLSECRPLFEPRSLQSADSLMDIWRAGLSRHNDTYLLAVSPVFPVLPASMVAMCLTEAGITGATLDALMAKHAELSNSFINGLKTAKNRHIYDFQVLQRGVLYGGVTSAEMSLLAGRPICLNQTQMKMLVGHLVSLLTDHANFEVAFATPDLQNSAPGARLWAQENSAAVATTISEYSFGPYAITATEPTVVGALYLYCEDAWLALPRVNRSREHVLEKLQKLLQLS
jgi:transcriptional regulator with XRE-family HTH domain